MHNQETLSFSTAGLLSQLIYRACKVAQYLLICVFYTLLTTLSYLYLSTIFKLQKDEIWTFIWLVGGIWVQFNMVFNYTMCVIVHPGSPKNIEYSQICQISQKCRKCNTIKVARSHHCSMCNSCILQMDHHCPWIGGCVGHHNRAYFMNFLNYTFIGLIILNRAMDQFMSSQKYLHEMFDNQLNDALMFQTYIFVSTLILVLAFFCVFHWYLALSGKTTLQYCFDDPRYTPSKSYLYNLTLIFGTANFIIIFLPKLSVLKMKGYEWQNPRIKQNTSMVQIQPAIQNYGQK